MAGKPMSVPDPLGETRSGTLDKDPESFDEKKGAGEAVSKIYDSRRMINSKSEDPHDFT